MKVTIHGIFDYPYVERTGDFRGTSDEWDAFFLVSICIATALLFCSKLSELAPRTQRLSATRIHALALTKNIRLCIITIILLIYFLNWQYGFFRIGVARELNLPFGLNAPASFMVYLGAPMLAAILASESVGRCRSVSLQAIIGVALVALIAAVTTYSRATILVVMAPIVLGMYKISFQINGKKQSKLSLVLVLAPTLILALASVSYLRIFVYGAGEVGIQDSIEIYWRESLGLFVDRWVGAEGMMVAVSTNSSIDLFLYMLTENPASGVDSIYQWLSGSQYYGAFHESMTFLTLPGVFAILAFSGNFAIIFLGILVIFLIGLNIEQYTLRLFPGNHPMHYLVAGAVAYHFSQMIFPKLLIPFILQTAFFLFVFHLFVLYISRNRSQA